MALYIIRSSSTESATTKRKLPKPKGASNRCEEIKQLEPIRERVTKLIEERREVLRGNVEQERQLARALNSELAVEVDLHLSPRQGSPQPEFTVQELDQLEANAIKLRDSQMLTTVQITLNSIMAKRSAVSRR